MLALVLVVGHFILTRLGIAYRAVTNFYSTGGKSICDDAAGNEQTSDSYRKSRHKSAAVTTGTGIASASQAYMHSGIPSVGPPIETQPGLPSTMTVPTSDHKKSKITVPGTVINPTIQASAVPTGYPGSTIMDPALSKVLPPQDEFCGPEISPSRMVTGPLPAECNATANWRQSRGRASAYVEGEERTMAASGYVGQDRSMAASGYVGQDRTMSGYVGQDRTMTGYVGQDRMTATTAYGGSSYPSQQRTSYATDRTAQGSAYYGGMSHHSAVTGVAAYEQSRTASMRGSTRQSAALATHSAGNMSQAGPPPNGEMMKKLKVQFRPSKIPSAYRFPRPDDIPCSNEDYPPNAQEHHGSGSRLTSYTTTTTPRASPPRSVSSQRPPTAYSRGTAVQSGAYANGYMAEDIDEVVSLQTGYQAQLGGVSGASGMYTGAETTGIGSMPQATTTIGYEQSQHATYQQQPQSGLYSSAATGYQTQTTGYQPQAPSRMQTQQSAFSAVPPSQSAYATPKSAYQMDSNVGSSRLTSVRSATTKNCRPIPAWNCGKATGFDDGPLPRPPKRKTMSVADDFGVASQVPSRASTKRQGMPGSETPSSTVSPEVDFLTTSISQMPQSAPRSVAPTAISRQMTPGSVMSTTARSHHSARSADMHVQQAVSQGAMTSAHYGTSLSRAGAATPPQSTQRRSQRTAVLEMDCTNTDQYNEFN